MPAVKTKRISTLIESQLPAFISSEYELFGKFVQKYYEAQEVQGGTLDVISMENLGSCGCLVSPFRKDSIVFSCFCLSMILGHCGCIFCCLTYPILPMGTLSMLVLRLYLFRSRGNLLLLYLVCCLSMPQT